MICGHSLHRLRRQFPLLWIFSVSPGLISISRRWRLEQCNTMEQEDLGAKAEAGGRHARAHSGLAGRSKRAVQFSGQTACERSYHWIVSVVV